MALVIILIKDTPQGSSVNVNSEPAMPSSVLEGMPSPAQTAAALMLNSLTKAAGPASPEAGDPPRVIVPH